MGKKILLLFMMVWLSVGVNAHKGSCDATWLGESKTCPPDLESAGFYIPNGTPNTLKAANGMNYFVSAQYFYEYLNATYSEYKQVFRNVYEMKQKFNTGIYYQGNRQNGQPGGHIDVRYNGYYGHMYKEFKTNVGFY